MEIVADRLDEPVGIAVDQVGTIFVSEAESGRIARLTPDGHRTILPLRFDHPMGLAIDHQGQLLIVEQGRGQLWRLDVTGVRTVLASHMRAPRWVTVAEDGTIYISARGLARDHGDDRDEADREGRGERREDAEKSDVILRLGTDGA